MSKLPPLNALKAFEAVARHRNISRASRELGVSHSAVSQHVKALEVWFSTDLVIRHDSGVDLTDEGKSLSAAATKGFSILHDACDAVTHTKENNRLSLHVEPAFGGKWMRRRLQPIAAALGGASVEMWSNPVHPDRFPNDADLLIHYRDDAEWLGVETFPIVELHGFVAGSPALLERKGAPRTPQDIERFHILHGEDRSFWDQWLKTHEITSITAQSGTLFGDYTLTVEAAVEGEGLLIADPILCERELADGRLKPLFDDTFYCMTYFVSCHKNQLQRPLVRKARSWIMNELYRVGGKKSGAGSGQYGALA